jgi:hypothetical protein
VTDLADTAAILSNLDLLISIDSAPVHLAGALGVPCWTMLDFAPDWRWLRVGDTTHWYQPNFRLFRQPAPGDWGSVVEALAGVLAGVALNWPASPRVPAGLPGPAAIVNE